MDVKDIENLKKYIVDQITTSEVKESILNLLHKSKRSNMTVYRGHGRSRTIRDSIFYSSTESEDVAREEFSGNGCCVFKINLVDVPVIDVNKVMTGNIGSYEDEKEYIFLGGGKFYKTRELDDNNLGFSEIAPSGTFETWYTIKPEPPEESQQSYTPIDTRSVIDRVLTIIPKDEYEFYDTPDEIKYAVSSYGIILGDRDAKLVFEKMKTD